IFDLYKMKAFPYSQRDKNVFFKAEEFKTRIIELSEGGKIPECRMDSYVMFIVIKGEAVVTADSKKQVLDSGKCFISKPAVLSLKANTDTRILGIQINKNK
ncbi:MAG: hypothetical protein R6U35_02975, partial [Candidatus Humimicrobiaceae bacterium]